MVEFISRLKQNVLRLISCTCLLFILQDQPANSSHQRQLSGSVPVALAWRSDGDLLAVAVQEEIWLYSSSKEPITKLAIDADLKPTYLVWHPTLSKLAASTFSNTSSKTYIWSVSGDPARLTITLDRIVEDFLSAWEKSPGVPDTRLAVSTTSDTIQVWDIVSGQLLNTIRPKIHAGVDAIAWSPNGQYLAAAMSDYKVWIWDMYTYQPITALPNPVASAVAWNPTSDQLAVGSGETIAIWERDLGSYQLITTFTENTAIVRRLDWKANRLASSASDNVIHVWNSTTWEDLGTFQASQEPGAMFALALSPDGGYLAYSGENGLELTDLTTCLSCPPD